MYVSGPLAMHGLLQVKPCVTLLGIVHSCMDQNGKINIQDQVSYKHSLCFLICAMGLVWYVTYATCVVGLV